MAQTREGAMKAAASFAGVSLQRFEQLRAAGQKWCGACHKWHPQTAFGKDRTRWDGLATVCLAYRKNRHKRTYESRSKGIPRGTPPIPARPGDKRQARRRVNVLVRTGRLPRPNTLPCTDCGHVWSPGERRHEYDHHLGYGANHHLDVQAVCTRCHRARETKRNPSYGNGRKKNAAH